MAICHEADQALCGLMVIALNQNRLRRDSGRAPVGDLAPLSPCGDHPEAEPRLVRLAAPTSKTIWRYFDLGRSSANRSDADSASGDRREAVLALFRIHGGRPETNLALYRPVALRPKSTWLRFSPWRST